MISNFGVVNGFYQETPEERRHRAWRDYAQSYEAWIESLENQSALGVRSAAIQLARLKRCNLLEPLAYDRPAHPKNGDEDGFGDPADFAIDRTDPRESIVDFDSVGEDQLKKLCDHFAAALVWATKSKNEMQPPLVEMGIKWLAIFVVMRPSLVGEMDFRLPRPLTSGLRGALSERDPLETGLFFCKPLAWVRKCSSLLQLGKRGYSATYVLRGDLINSATCAAIGGLDNKSRQAANKPIQEFRDTFGGIKSLPMRGTETRKRCKEAQEKNWSFAEANYRIC